MDDTRLSGGEGRGSGSGERVTIFPFIQPSSEATFRHREAKGVQPHRDAPAAEGDAFTLQPKPLLHSRMSAKLNFAARAHHTMPRNRAVSIPQSPGNLPSVPWKSGGAGYVAIGRDLASWNLPDRRYEIAENERAACHTTGAASRIWRPIAENF